MKIKADTHIHTNYSTDSTTPVQQQIEKASSMGMEQLCITDHMDYDFPKDEYLSTTEQAPFCFDWKDYVKTLETCKKDAPLQLFLGVECGLQATSSVVKKNQALVSDKSLDYVIGSLHLIDKKDPYYPSFWEKQNPDTCIFRYFELLYENIQAFHDFDSLGHLDYIVRYAPYNFQYTPKKYQDILEAILSFIIRKDIALEVNTSGLKAENGNTNPHLAILQQYVSLGGELITIGSDAHTPEYLGFRFDDMSTLLRQIGLHQYCVYDRRKPIFYDC